MIEGEDRQTSEFNMAIAWLNSLHGLFCICIESRLNLDAHSWFNALYALSTELSTEFDKSDTAQEQQIRQTLPTLLQEHNIQKTRTGRNEIRPELYEVLDDYNRMLKKVLKKSGLLTRFKDDASRALR